jgi:hypothetical protein
MDERLEMIRRWFAAASREAAAAQEAQRSAYAAYKDAEKTATRVTWLRDSLKALVDSIEGQTPPPDPPF